MPCDSLAQYPHFGVGRLKFDDYQGEMSPLSLSCQKEMVYSRKQLAWHKQHLNFT